MTKDEALKLAQEVCPYFDERLKGAFYEGFITALDQLPDTTKMMGLIPSEWAGLEGSPNSTTDVVESVACIVGIKGSAYAPTDTKRAYTYANQPGNVVAYKLGRASSSASLQRAGDFIDSGLILLKELQVEGYGVFDIGAEYTAPPKHEWVGVTGDEIDDIAAESGFGYINVARAIEAKLKEKNHVS